MTLNTIVSSILGEMVGLLFLLGLLWIVGYKVIIVRRNP
jgi:hypothetical protein